MDDKIKASSADHGTKIDVIQQNRHKYSKSTMCKVLRIARSTFYSDTEVSVQKEQEMQEEERVLKEKITKIFNKNRQVSELGS